MNLLVILLMAGAAGPGSPASPGSIVGSWRIGCPDDEGMIIEFTLADARKAIGRVVEPGAAAKYGYKKGEEMFHLNAEPKGDWLGEVHWRGVSGAQHWDSIRMAVSGHTLAATMTNEACYKNMTRR